MSRATAQKPSRRPSSAPSSCVAPLQTTPPCRTLTRAPSSPPDLHPSLGMEFQENGCKGGDEGSLPIENTKTGASSKPNVKSSPPDTSRPRLQQQKVQKATVEEDSVPMSPELARWIRLRAQDLVIRQNDRQWAVKQINQFRDKLLDFLKSSDEQPYFQSASWLSSGSYYEMVKIHKPNEFDVMLKLQSPSQLKLTELDQYHGLFYELALSRRTRTNIRAFLLEDELTISASKILKEMHRLVRKFMSTYKVSEGDCCWVVNKKKPNSPAVTLSLMEGPDKKEELLSLDVVPALEVPSSQGWPLSARGGLNVENWLGKKTRRILISKTCYFVPKRPTGRNLTPAAKESWRISFSHIEKEIIMFHGNKKTCCESAATRCCRKQCFKLLKCLIEGLKQRYPQELDSLCSYHGKTAFLHTLSNRGQDSEWSRHQLPACFMHLLGALEGHARSGVLPHFFVTTYNLFSPPAFPSKALAFLTRALEEQRRQGLPLLNPPSPAPPLALDTSPSNPSSPSDPLQDQIPLATAKFNSLNVDLIKMISVVFISIVLYFSFM